MRQIWGAAEEGRQVGGGTRGEAGLGEAGLVEAGVGEAEGGRQVWGRHFWGRQVLGGRKSERTGLGEGGLGHRQRLKKGKPGEWKRSGSGYAGLRAHPLSVPCLACSWLLRSHAMRALVKRLSLWLWGSRPYTAAAYLAKCDMWLSRLAGTRQCCPVYRCTACSGVINPLWKIASVLTNSSSLQWSDA